jgi:ADP-ribose pyrophosphatase
MNREIVHVGRRIQVAIERGVSADGREYTRDVVLHPGAVVILPVLDAEHIVLLRNHRPIVGEVLWEVPAGTLEPGEALEEAAKRELQEETGYTANLWNSLGYLFASPGVLNEKLHLFVARELTPGLTKLEADEEMQSVTLSVADAIRMVLTGEIKDAKTITVLLLWDRMRRGG